MPAPLGRGEILGEAVNLTRRLVNEPPSDIYPESFADEAVRVAEASGIAIEVWDQARLEAERCGSLLAVARGSDRAAAAGDPAVQRRRKQATRRWPSSAKE